MTGPEMLEASAKSPDGTIIVVNRNSGKKYSVDRDVIRANANDDRPYIYGWPLKPSPRQPRAPIWFYASSVSLSKEFA